LPSKDRHRHKNDVHHSVDIHVLFNADLSYFLVLFLSPTDSQLIESKQRASPVVAERHPASNAPGE
jgi:hypothetical protein